MAQARTNLKGKTFGRLKVRRVKRVNVYGHVVWLCDCECGTKNVARPGNVLQQRERAGHVQSCGCFVKEQNLERRKLSKSAAAVAYMKKKTKAGIEAVAKKFGISRQCLSQFIAREKNR